MPGEHQTFRPSRPIPIVTQLTLVAISNKSSFLTKEIAGKMALCCERKGLFVCQVFEFVFHYIKIFKIMLFYTWLYYCKIY